MSLVNQDIVLVLNKQWQALNVRTPAEAFAMLAGGSATALDVPGLVPTRWTDWIKLPIREGDDCLNTPNQSVRIPRVIIAVNYDKVHVKKRALNGRTIRERDGGVCQYSGRKLAHGEGNLDHVIPRSRGGRTSWDNLVLAHKDINSRKADKTPEEAGLKLLRKPTAPAAARPAEVIKPLFPEWEMFLKR